MSDLAIKATTAILFAAICAVITWAVFGFIAWDWDFTEWDSFGRLMFVCVNAILNCLPAAGKAMNE